MKKFEIKDIISILNRREFARFGKYIHSPYFRISGRVTELYDYIEKNYDDIMIESVSREKAASKVLKGSKSEENIRKLFSDFNKSIEDFIILTGLESDSDIKKITFLKKLRSGNRHERFATKLKEAKKDLRAKEPDFISYKFASAVYEQEFLSETESDFHNHSEALQKESDYLDAFYISSKLLIFQQMYSKQILNKEPIGYKWNMNAEIESFISNNSAEIKEKYPDIYLKHLMLMLVKHNDENLIHEYRNYLDSKTDLFSKQQAAEFYSDLYNYLTIRVNGGEYKFRKVILETVKFLDNKGLLLDTPSEKIHTYTFKQIADTAFHLREFDWAGYFIKKYSPEIEDIHKKDIINLVYAKLYYYKKEMNTSRLYLAKVNYKDFIHYLDAKMFQIRVEYSDENYNEIQLVADSINKYIKKHPEIPANTVENSIRFLYYIRVILRIKENLPSKDNYEIEKMIKQLEEEKRSVYSKPWLLEKLEGLKK